MKIIIFKNRKWIVCDWTVASSYANLPEVKEIRDATKEEIEDWLKED